MKREKTLWGCGGGLWRPCGGCQGIAVAHDVSLVLVLVLDGGRNDKFHSCRLA